MESSVLDEVFLKKKKKKPEENMLNFSNFRHTEMTKLNVS